MSFFNLLMLTGLAAVAIPPIIHLLNRRRYEVVDWGAMQFLQISEITRRRLLIEEILLMLLRMGLIALFVLALAGPFTDSSNELLRKMTGASQPNRDVVIVFDGSASMSFRSGNQSAQEKARDWANAFLSGMRPGDGVAILLARQQPVPLLDRLTTDLEKARKALQELPPPAGGCDWPRAVQAAESLLETSQKGEREIILLSDGQKQGWADAQALTGWETLKQIQTGKPTPAPRVWAVNLDPSRPENPANWSLTPLTGSRAVVTVGQEILFRSALRLSGSARYVEPHELRLDVDGRFVRRLPAPRAAQLEAGQVPFSFTHRFNQPGTHLVSVLVEPDVPANKRPADYTLRDRLPADNRVDMVVEVVEALPVLIVDGEEVEANKPRGSDFLQTALEPKEDPSPAARVKIVSPSAFRPALLANDPPRVLVLVNVKRLSLDQANAVATFLKEGGGVLVTLGNRCDAKAYNELENGGKGWFPAQLERIVDEETDLAKAARPLPSTFFHPALDLFRKESLGGLDTAWFARWWKLKDTTDRGGSSVLGLFNREDAPFLLERRFGDGRVLLSTVPLDKSWRTNLPDLPAFVPLTHELIYYLAGTRGAEHNLPAGQPLRYRLPPDTAQDGFTLQAPSDREPKPIVVGVEQEERTYAAQVVTQAQGNLLVHEGMREPGVWLLETPDGQTVHYVVQPDARENDLASAREDDRTSVNRLFPVEYENDADSLLSRLSQYTQRLEFWDWMLLAVLGLLCVEVWFTRRIVINRS